MIRLFVEEGLRPGYPDISLSKAQAHYLCNVMRLRDGDEVVVFNGRDPEALTILRRNVGRGADSILAIERLGYRPFVASPDLCLVAAMVKRGRLEMIVEKATELGVRHVQLAITERTNMDHTNVPRLQSIAIEASEQTERMDVPEIVAPRHLKQILADWPAERPLMFCDEAGDAPPALAALAGRPGGTSPGAWGVLVGPEGGFSPRERALIRGLAQAVPVSLGPRILRADTAAIAALTLWQSALGDLKTS